MNLDQLLELFGCFNARYYELELPTCSIEYSEDLAECSAGRWDPENNRILIREGLCDRQQRITLLHEMIHMRIDGHGIDYQEELNRCAKISSPGFREEILFELQRVRDFDRWGPINRNTLIEWELKRLAVDHGDWSWMEIRQSLFEAIFISDPESAQLDEGWISALWDFIRNGSIGQPPSAPVGSKQNGIF